MEESDGEMERRVGGVGRGYIERSQYSVRLELTGIHCPSLSLKRRSRLCVRYNAYCLF